MSEDNKRAIIVGVDMPMGDMVKFMVKWAIASIPAALILAIFGFIAAAFLAALGTGIK